MSDIDIRLLRGVEGVHDVAPGGLSLLVLRVHVGGLRVEAAHVQDLVLLAPRHPDWRRRGSTRLLVLLLLCGGGAAAGGHGVARMVGAGASGVAARSLRRRTSLGRARGSSRLLILLVLHAVLSCGAHGDDRWSVAAGHWESNNKKLQAYFRE